MASKRKTAPKTAPRQWVFGAIVNSVSGQVSLIEPDADLFRKLGGQLLAHHALEPERTEGTHIGRPGGPRSTTDLAWYMGIGGAGAKRYSRYQWLTGTVLPSLRDRLLPDEDDFEAILDQIDFYRRRIPWVGRALQLWAAINSRQFRVDAPDPDDKDQVQTKWLLDLKTELRMFSFMREFFWSMRAHDQAVVMWRTTKNGRDPLSIEIPDLKVYQPRWNPKDGSRPRIVVVASNDDHLKKLVEIAQGHDTELAVKAQARLKSYPAPMVDAIRDTKAERVEIDAETLEPYGLHFEYAARNRRHWEDWAFPGMYSIFPYLEMLLMADDADVNALHHYKAGILLVRLGPEEPKDMAMVATEGELKAIDKKLVDMAKARLPAWAARGDLRVEWVVPPADIISDAKVKSAREKVKDYFGIPRIAWPGEDFTGSFAAGLVTLKILEQESEDDRGIARELFEGWFHDRSKETNKFKGAVRPRVWFDPTALKEQRLILDTARLMLEANGADEQTILETMGYDAETVMSRRRAMRELASEYGEEIPVRGQISGQPGRPPKIGQPTPETSQRRQPRPSTSEAGVVDRTIGAIHNHFGISLEDLRTAVESEGVVT